MKPLALDAYDWDRETIEEQSDSGHYNPAQVVVWNGQRHIIGAGSSDDVDLFTDDEEGELFVLARNRPLNYAGLEIWRHGERIADTFTDAEGPADSLNELEPLEAAQTLRNYMDY
jgi:hypothetical protein